MLLFSDTYFNPVLGFLGSITLLVSILVAIKSINLLQKKDWNSKFIGLTLIGVSVLGTFFAFELFSYL